MNVKELQSNDLGAAFRAGLSRSRSCSRTPKPNYMKLCINHIQPKWLTQDSVSENNLRFTFTSKYANWQLTSPFERLSTARAIQSFPLLREVATFHRSGDPFTMGRLSSGFWRESSQMFARSAPICSFRIKFVLFCHQTSSSICKLIFCSIIWEQWCIKCQSTWRFYWGIRLPATERVWFERCPILQYSTGGSTGTRAEILFS